MNSTVQRRPLGQILKKAPQQLWEKHKSQYTQILFNPNNSFSDRGALTRTEQAKTFATSSYSIFPIRNSGVLPLFAPDGSKNQQQMNDNNNLFSFDYRATGFVWPLYKPPFLKMMNINNNNNNSQNNSSSNENNNNSVEEFVEKTFDFASAKLDLKQEVDEQKTRCPFHMAASIELAKLRQHLEGNPNSNNVNILSKEDRNQLRKDLGEDAFNENEFLAHNRKMFERAEALTGVGIVGEHARLRKRNLLKAATAAEIPHLLAFHWANLRGWNYEFGTILANDISGVVPVAIMEEQHLNQQQQQQADNNGKPSFSDLISKATFEAVVEGHIPRSLPSTKLEMLSHNNSNNIGNSSCFVKMMKNGKNEFESNKNNNNSSMNDEDISQLSNVEISSAVVVRHGYYLQEPVTVVRWSLKGRNCARVSPNEVLNKIFAPIPHQRNTSTVKNNNNSKNVDNNYNNNNFYVVGHPASRMTQKYDISIPMCCLRGVQIGNSGGGGGENNNDGDGNRVIALPRSPYSSEEMISSAPNSSRFQDALRKASLMDGYWTP